MDVLAGTVVALDTAGHLARHEVPSQVATVIRRRTSGGFAIVSEQGLIGVDDALATFEPIARILHDKSVRTNDGGCDPLGGFVIGSMSYDERPNGGAVYRVSPNRQVTELLSPVSISNGIQWSADGTRVFYIDTPTRRVDAFDVDQTTGAWTNRRAHIHINEAPGFPDGMAIDEEGGLWIALWGGGIVNHYDSKGRLAETIRVPNITQPSSCAFGGGDRDILYITTSRQGLTDHQERSAGAIFAIHTSSRGAALAEFAG